MELDAWMAKHEISDDTLASRAGVDRSTISRIRRKKRRASPELGQKLIALSQGEVTWPELYGLPAKEEAA